MQGGVRWLVRIAALVVAAGSACAATAFYDDRAAFLSAAGAVFNLDFNALPPPDGYVFISGETYNDVLFQSPDGNLVAIEPGFAPAYYQWDSEAVVAGYYYGSPIQAQLPAGIYYVGADVMLSEYSTGGISGTMTAVITFDDTTQLSQSITTLGQPDRAFMGFISDKQIVQIDFYTPDTDPDAGWYPFPLIDNFVTLPAIPEPSSLILACGGVAVFLAGRRGMDTRVAGP